jgi:hypothetical protein
MTTVRGLWLPLTGKHLCRKTLSLRHRAAPIAGVILSWAIDTATGAGRRPGHGMAFRHAHRRLPAICQ